MAEPGVSVIVPVYNAAAFLKECLDSLINQTLKGIEIICVNDGSQDDSQEILEDYQKRDRRIRIVNKKNGGLSSARNAGMKIATGEYIGFVDSDDWIDLDFFEKLYHSAGECAADISMGNLKRIFSPPDQPEEISWIGKLIDRIDVDVIENVNDRKKVIHTNSVCNKLFLRKFLAANNFWFFEGLYWEDNPFTIMTVIKANRISLVRDVYYYNRKHPLSITGEAVFDRKSFDIFEIMHQLKKFFDEENVESMDGYKNYFNELLILFYFNHLLNRIHGKFKKEFYCRMKNEFSNLEETDINFLCGYSKNFVLMRKHNYMKFKFIYFLQRMKEKAKTF